jgi:hypothetical protein
LILRLGGEQIRLLAPLRVPIEATSVKIIVVANIFRKNLLMKKQILIGLGVFVALLLVVNGVVAVSHFAREAIKDFSLRGQISSFADELLEAGLVAKQELKDNLRDELEDACDAADKLLTYHPSDLINVDIYASLTQQIDWVKELISYAESEQGDFTEGDKNKVLSDFRPILFKLESRYDQYLAAKADCDRLTQDYQDKYGD